MPFEKLKNKILFPRKIILTHNELRKQFKCQEALFNI